MKNKTRTPKNQNSPKSKPAPPAAPLRELDHEELRNVTGGAYEFFIPTQGQKQGK